MKDINSYLKKILKKIQKQKIFYILEKFFKNFYLQKKIL